MTFVDPSVTVTVTSTPGVRGESTDTGRLRLLYADAAALTTDPGKDYALVTSATAADDAGAPAAIVNAVARALAIGVPDIALANAEATNYSAVTQAEWASGLSKFDASLGAGQVIIPGHAEANAYAALLAYCALSAGNNVRGILDGGEDDIVAATLASTASGLASATGSTECAMVAPYVDDIPGSVIAAGLAAALDHAVGHAGHSVQWSFGVVPDAAAVSQTFSDADRATLTAAGVNVFRAIPQLGNAIALNTWNTLKPSAAVLTKFGYSRLVMQVTGLTINAGANFIGEPIDTRGLLYHRIANAITGLLTPLAKAGGLDSFTVACDLTNNSADDRQSGTVNVDISLWFPGVAETLSFRIALNLA